MISKLEIIYIIFIYMCTWLYVDGKRSVQVLLPSSFLPTCPLLGMMLLVPCRLLGVADIFRFLKCCYCCFLSFKLSVPSSVLRSDCFLGKHCFCLSFVTSQICMPTLFRSFVSNYFDHVQIWITTIHECRVNRKKKLLVS